MPNLPLVDESPGRYGVLSGSEHLVVVQHPRIEIVSI